MDGKSFKVPQSKDGPIHGCEWSPTGKDFVVMAGSVPPRITMFKADGTVLRELGEGPFNCAFFSPQGRFLCLGGFGNLPGTLEFWDRSTTRDTSLPS